MQITPNAFRRIEHAIVVLASLVGAALVSHNCAPKLEPTRTAPLSSTEPRPRLERSNAALRVCDIADALYIRMPAVPKGCTVIPDESVHATAACGIIATGVLIAHKSDSEIVVSDCKANHQKP